MIGKKLPGYLAEIFAQSALQIGATQQPNLNLCPDWQGTVWQTISETLVLRMVPLMAVMAGLYLLVGFFQPLIMTVRTVPRSNKIIFIRMKIDVTCTVAHFYQEHIGKPVSQGLFY